MRTTLAICSAILLAGCTGEIPVDETEGAVQGDLAPNGKGALTRDANASKKPGGGAANGINYHGGPVMLGTVNIYYIWYGNWSGNSANTILTNFISNLGGSGYEHINSTYYDGSNNHVSGNLHYAGSTTDSYSQGSSNLTDANIATVVSNAITSGSLPLDANGIYFVLTSADVTKSGFCSQYCGWHTHQTVSGADVKYAFVGNPDQCPSACEQQTTGPNGNAGADGMASIIAHESEEAISDPDLNAWYDRRGNENADKCAWTFGSTSTASNGSLYNITLGGANYLIQQNWVNANGGFCAMSF
jgi:phosphate-induced protein 1